MPSPSSTPEPPYYAVIFTSLRSEDDQGYAAMAGRMEQLARAQEGFLGMESARGSDGLGITVSYWKSEESIRAWKQHVDHQEAQRRGQSEWYTTYQVRVARVDRQYGKSLS